MEYTPYIDVTDSTQLPPILSPLWSHITTPPYPSEFGFTSLLPPSTSQTPQSSGAEECYENCYAKVTSSEIDFAALAVDISSLPEIITVAIKLNEGIKRPWVTEEDQELGLKVTLMLILLHPKLPSPYKFRSLHTSFLRPLASSPRFLRGELYMLNLASTRSSKCSELWHYRRSVLDLMLNAGVKVSWRDELEWAGKCIDREPKNYYAWNHKVMVARRMREDTTDGGEGLWDQALSFCFSNPNDYSGISYLHVIGTIFPPFTPQLLEAMEGFKTRAQLSPPKGGVWWGYRAVLDLASGPVFSSSATHFMGSVGQAEEGEIKAWALVAYKRRFEHLKLWDHFKEKYGKYVVPPVT
ncbi:hypothetical protein TrCOL_g12029 [Triparma columacea]|uniref:Uncharacterized protein n=1 Tax=Triparma columacea TaxID=722753 RepID=A0A9W7FX25_9STRA|nr:hypothetical protein TrCOL_g12029 [Triparma columacea]